MTQKIVVDHDRDVSLYRAAKQKIVVDHERDVSLYRAAKQKIVVDHERDVSLYRAAKMGRIPGDGFLLTWGDRQIPFESLSSQVSDPVGGESYYLVKFTAFGVSAAVELRTKVNLYRFGSDEELATARRLAAEALLVYGLSCNGPTYPDGENRVELHGVELRLIDFGIEGASA
ncbi:hypothetical protein [Cryobacterium sp. MP_3.1]|uniref:hypothetical protein n=1 Tax=Cryobacterium sp. MP_3.1 TaxID=3071711 RepID=UPI002E0E2252